MTYFGCTPHTEVPPGDCMEAEIWDRGYGLGQEAVWKDGVREDRMK